MLVVLASPFPGEMTSWIKIQLNRAEDGRLIIKVALYLTWPLASRRGLRELL